jgi:hypothetical protein
MVINVLLFTSKHTAADPALTGHTFQASFSYGSDGFTGCL